MATEDGTETEWNISEGDRKLHEHKKLMREVGALRGSILDQSIEQHESSVRHEWLGCAEFHPHPATLFQLLGSSFSGICDITWRVS